MELDGLVLESPKPSEVISKMADMPHHNPNLCPISNPHPNPNPI